MTIPRLSTISLALLFSVQALNASAARSLTVNVYIHDDLADMQDAQLHNDYFEHWLKEMRRFTDHPIEVIFQRNVPLITDIAYAGMPSSQILEVFTDGIHEKTRHSPFSFVDKHLLLTRDSYDRSGWNYTAGLAYTKQNTAISSIAAYGAPAHEIGHMLGATHEDAELKFNGWVCETYTHPRVTARSNCYRYSDKNRATIADYLKYNSK